MTTVETIITLVVAIFASNGLWALFNTMLTRRYSKQDDKSKTAEESHKELKGAIDKIEESNALQQEMLKGLAHDRILSLGSEYIERGYITPEEYDNLYNYIYVPAKKLNINGSSKRIMDKIQDLPIKE